MQMQLRSRHAFGEKRDEANIGRSLAGWHLGKAAQDWAEPVRLGRTLNQTSHAGTQELFDVGEHLADLAPKISALAGARIEIDTAIALPHSHVRMAGAEFDAIVMKLIADALAAGASTIRVRSRLIGARVWTLICDDRPGPVGTAATPISGKADAEDRGAKTPIVPLSRWHGRLLSRSSEKSGTSTALILPTVLRVSDLKPRVSQSRGSRILEEISHGKDRRPVAA